MFLASHCLYRTILRPLKESSRSEGKSRSQSPDKHMIFLLDHSPMQKLSVDVRFPELGTEGKKNASRMSSSEVGPISSCESGESNDKSQILRLVSLSFFHRKQKRRFILAVIELFLRWLFEASSASGPPEISTFAGRSKAEYLHESYLIRVSQGLNSSQPFTHPSSFLPSLPLVVTFEQSYIFSPIPRESRSQHPKVGIDKNNLSFLSHFLLIAPC